MARIGVMKTLNRHVGRIPPAKAALPEMMWR
jgi:hypothetical protein